LQRTISEPGSIFQIERITRAVAEALYRWRHQRIGKAFFDICKLRIEFFIDIRRAAAPLIERLENDISHREVRCIDLLQSAEA
jgi:hypothetical protein